MTREEKIFIESNKYAIEMHDAYPSIDIDDYAFDFRVGAQWADENPQSPWVSVKEDLPCNHEELIIKHDDWEILETKPIFVHYKNGSFGIRHMWKSKNEPWIWFPNTSDIDYWMSIPEPPKE